MDPDVASISTLAVTGADAGLVVLLVGIGVGVGLAVGTGATRFLRRRRGGVEPPFDDVERRPIGPSGVGLAEDPIVVALGVKDDEATRARRRRRPIGAGLQTPPGDSPPPT